MANTAGGNGIYPYTHCGSCVLTVSGMEKEMEESVEGWGKSLVGSLEWKGLSHLHHCIHFGLRLACTDQFGSIACYEVF